MIQKAEQELAQNVDMPPVVNDITNYAPARPHIQHQILPTDNRTAEQYAYDARTLHRHQYDGQGNRPPEVLKWVGDASLAVPPKNRMLSAIGLTAGLLVAGNMANIATGYKLSDGKPVEKVPTFLKWMQGIVKNYNPNGLDQRNRFIKYGQMAIYSLGGLIGVKIGTDFAYKDAVKANKNPHYLEDYLTAVSHTQGKTWSWLSAASGIWGSASGMWATPLPGLNYATGMVGRITSMQDRNTMIEGLNKTTSGATTSSYLRLKEGMNYLAHYATGNPAKDPTVIEYLGYTLLGPVFKDKLTAAHIKQFTEAVHEVRDHYWQEGGIPKNKRKEALQTMKEVFTGAGLEVLLIDMGLNPATVSFDEANGLIGKIGNVGQKEKIHKLQNEYWNELSDRLPRYVAAGVLSQERADWVQAGIADMKKGIAPKEPAPEHEDLSQSYAPEKAEAAAKLIGKPRNKKSIDTLLDSAKQSGDWREIVLKERQKIETPAFTLE